MAGQAIFFRIKNTMRKAKSVQSNKPISGVSNFINTFLFDYQLINKEKYCILRPVHWMQYFLPG
jgi:hypothetical protein